MSVVIAVKKDDVVYMGCDTLTTAGDRKFFYINESGYKIQKLDNGILLGFTGEVGTIQKVISLSDKFTLDKKGNLTKKHIVTEIMPEIFMALKEDERFDKNEELPEVCCSILMAYKDKMFRITENFNVFEFDDYQVLGSGSSVAYYSLDNIDKNRDINEQIIKTLKVSSKYISSVSGPYVLIDTKNLEYKVVVE